MNQYFDNNENLKSKIEKLKFDNSELRRKCDELSHLTERNPSECIFVPKESYRTDIPYKSEPTKQEERLSISMLNILSLTIKFYKTTNFTQVYIINHITNVYIYAREFLTKEKRRTKSRA